jgi:hypothetical protein
VRPVASTLAATLIFTATIAGCGNGKKDAASSTRASSATSSTAAATRPALDDTTRLTAGGFGPLRVNMTLAEARNATRSERSYVAPGGADGLTCPRIQTGIPDVHAIMTSATAPELIIEIDVRHAAILTDAGMHVGSVARDVRRAYAAVQPVNSHYAEALVASDGPNALVFRFNVAIGQPITDDAVVNDMSATRADSVRAEELCS